MIYGDVAFDDGADTLNLETSSTLTGAVPADHETDGGGGIDTVNLFGTGFGAYTGRFLGMEVLNKNESGTWTLSGGSFVTPSVVTATNVNAGRLNVNGWLETDATINPTGTLGGIGTIDGNVVNAGGTISPGNSIGTLTVTEDYSESAASTHEIEIDSLGNSDLLNVLGTHTIFEPGSKLLVRNQAGDYWRGGEVYRFVEAAGGRSGEFDPTQHMVMSDDGDDIKLFLDYHPTDIELTSIPLDFGALGMGGNLQLIGDYLDSLIPLNEICESRLCYLASELGLLDDVGVKNGLKQLSPEYYDSYITVGLQQAREFGDVAHSRMGALRRGEAAMGNSRYGGSVGPTAAAGAMGMAGTLPGQPYAEGKINPWLRGFGGAGQKDARNTHIDYDWAGGGGALGVDFLVNDDLLLGLMGGYSQAKVDYGHVGGESDIGLAWGGIYATYFKKNWYVDGLFGYGRNFFDSKRKISIGDFGATANADPDGNNYTVAVDGGYNFQLGRGWGIEPNLRLSWARVDVDSFSESIGDAGGLDVDRISQDSLQTELGVRISKLFRSGDDVVWLPELRVGWVHEYLDDDRRISASFGNAPGSMKIHGDDPGKDGASVRTGMTVFINEMVSVYGFYNGDFKGDRMYNGGSGGVRLRF